MIKIRVFNFSFLLLGEFLQFLIYKQIYAY